MDSRKSAEFASKRGRYVNKAGTSKNRKGARMLKVDLNRGRYEIVQHITESCSKFGIVQTIRLFLGSSPTAAVEMLTMKETEELAVRLGGRLVGNMAFIALAQRPAGMAQEQAT